MLSFDDLRDNCMYILDLLQMYDGARMLRVREENDPLSEDAVFSTEPMSGLELRSLAQSGRPIPLMGGGHFQADEHGSWMTDEESTFLQTHQTSAALHDPNAPWVNHLPPKFVSS